VTQQELIGYPSGWFVICFSDELAAGATRALRYFGQDLVAYRGQDGSVRVLDAYCPHLGAHLGVGGKVVGDSIQCPFHAWRFCGTGECVEIPYATKIPPRARVRSWQVMEKNGVVLVHHDSTGKEPAFDIPVIEEYGSAEWLPWSTFLYHVKTHPKEIIDNLADRAHFPTVHRTLIDEFAFEVDGFTATQRAKGKSILPGDGSDEFASTTTYHGPGYFVMHFDGMLKNIMLLAHTPIDETELDLRLAVSLKIVGNRERTEGFVKRYLENLKAGFEDDLRIWEHKRYRDPPVLCDGDGPIGRMRRWYRQFYPAPAAPSEPAAASIEVQNGSPAPDGAVTTGRKKQEDPIMAAEEFVERAHRLLPALRERAAEAEHLRRIPDATIADFHDAGFFRMLKPARAGGCELDPKVFFEVQMRIASACPSSAWVLGVLGVHNWQLALFPLEAQEEVWAKDSTALISSSYAPTGHVEPVEGGYRLSGRWSFSSGCDHCQWVFLGGLLPPAAEGKPPEMRTFLLPRADYRIDDTWFVAGLKATGSKDIVVENAFVPEHRTHRLIDGYKRKSPGNAVNPAPLFRLPFAQVFVRSVSTSAVGAAQGALDVYRENAAHHVSASDRSRAAADPAAQILCAKAAATLDEVRLVLYRNMDEMMALARAGEDIPVARRVQFKYESARAVARCVEVVDELFAASGGRAIFLQHPLLRYFLDIHAVRAHYANNPDKPGRNFGAVQLALPNQDYYV
jgi:3-hydroxy-9,10-secoandrosta-1,3,5(10)-triene-9,17-dione monooxygenase